MSVLSRLLFKYFHVPEFIEYRKLPGWKGPLPFYRCYCRIHHLIYETYPSGYQGFLQCPECLAEAGFIAKKTLGVEPIF